jgi:hypothetical protein
MPQLLGASTTLDESTNTVISEFRLTQEHIGVMRSLATAFPLKPHEGTSNRIVTFGRYTAYGLDDGVDITVAQDLSDATVTYTPSEVGLKVILPRTTKRRIADPNIEGKIGRLISNAYRLKEDKDGADQLTSFSSTTLGSAGTVLSIGHLLAGAARLKTGSKRRTSTTDVEPAPGTHVGVFHSYSLSALAGKLIPLTDVPTGTNVYTGVAAGATVGPGRNSMGDDIIRNGVKAEGTYAGLHIYAEDNLLVDSSDDCTGAVFSKEALLFISEFEPEEWHEGDKSLRAVEIGTSGSYCFGLYKPDVFGIPCVFDATQPTA